MVHNCLPNDFLISGISLLQESAHCEIGIVTDLSKFPVCMCMCLITYIFNLFIFVFYLIKQYYHI